MTNGVTYSGWRPLRPHRPPHHGKDGKPTGAVPELPVIPAIRFFDNLSYIGDQFVGCFVVETSDGLLLIDSMFPGPRWEGILEEGLAALGYQGRNIRSVLVTHGHSDHYGCAGYLRETYGAKVYMSAIDEDFARDKSKFSPMGYLEFPIDGHLEDGQDFVQGDTCVHIALTPGHTPGCLSFLIPVRDEGRPHMAALWGGTGLPRDPALLTEYLRSAQRFTQLCDQYQVDVEIATHPFVDNSVERFEVVRNIFDGVANPYVIGREACRRYEDMFTQLCKSKMEQTT